MYEKFGQFIDGKWCQSSDKATYEVINPANEEVIGYASKATPEDVDKALKSAEKGMEVWKKTAPWQRSYIIRRIADKMREKQDVLAKWMTLEVGKPLAEAKGEIGGAADIFEWNAEETKRIYGQTVESRFEDTRVHVYYQPVGVVAAIVPWNSQLFLSAVKVGPALAAGCSVVLKASEEGPAPLLAFARLVHEAGFPAGVVNVITGFAAECGAVLTRHPDVAHVAFTGGPETAQHIVRNSAENLAKVSLELGGKSPFIVFADADLQSAVNAQVAAIFAATGQSCVAGSRLLVEESIKDEFVQRLVQRVQSIKIGLPEDMATEFGPLCTLRQRQKIEQIVASSIQQGAKLLTGGESIDRAGYYYPPTILDCSDATQADCVMNELFGPVLSVVSFKTELEAIHTANNTAYGLAAGVFTSNLSRAHRMTKAIQSGIVWLNTYRAVSPLAPFGGHGLSGHGREGGFEAVFDYTTTKTVWLRTSDQPIDDPFIMR